MRIKSMIGNRFGRLVVLEKSENDKHDNARWLCRCDCGAEKVIQGRHLRNGDTQSCGCLRRERSTKHGMWNTRTYRSWASMVNRCTNPNNPDFKYYGGRGITVCERWLKFENFFADMGEMPEGKSIDRIDNDKGYYPENCKWSTSKEQNNNRRPRKKACKNKSNRKGAA